MAEQRAESESHPKTGLAGIGMLRMAVNWGVAALSLAVIAAFVYWTVTLGTRDPHDVPIIRAMEGPSRKVPADPGGAQASHQGLAVNSVQAEGGVEKPANQVVLAPSPAELSDEDQPVSANRQASQNASLSDAPTPSAQSQSADPEADEIAEQVAAAVVAAQSDPSAKPRANIQGTEYSPAVSKRPKARPDQLNLQITAVEPTNAVSTGEALQFVPIGTRLIQLGAYDSRDLAHQEWAKLLSKHPDLLEGKKQLVQSANSGGRKFFRLRAVGFNSRDESRSLCSALLARGTPCIAVTAR